MNFTKRNNKLKELGFREYQQYLQSDHWIYFRNKIKKDRGNQCEKCRSSLFLNVHHETYKRLGAEKPEDVLLLCRDCHVEQHKRIELLSKKRKKLKKSLCCGEPVTSKKISGTQWRVICMKCGKRQHRVRRKMRLALKQQIKKEKILRSSAVPE